MCGLTVLSATKAAILRAEPARQSDAGLCRGVIVFQDYVMIAFGHEDYELRVKELRASYTHRRVTAEDESAGNTRRRASLLSALSALLMR